MKADLDLILHSLSHACYCGDLASQYVSRAGLSVVPSVNLFGIGLGLLTFVGLLSRFRGEAV